MLLIASTDTEVGKTVVTSALLAYHHKYHPQENWCVLKPIQCGTGDREFYHQLLSPRQSLEEINPIYLDAPLAPPLAADKMGVAIDLGIAWRTFQRLQAEGQRVLVEGIGGLGTPITAESIVADLARDWNLPTVLVVPVKLGGIGSAIANVALARQYHVNLRGIILNCAQPRSQEEIIDLASPALIQSLTHVPVLGCIPYLADLSDLDKLAAVASNLDLELLCSNPSMF
jgi:dethiobiotin synthetase